MKLKDFEEFESMFYGSELRQGYVDAKVDTYRAVAATSDDDLHGRLDAIFGGMMRATDRAMDFKLAAYHEWLRAQLEDR